MSRIGKRVLTIPEKVNVELEGQKLTVKGPKGELSLDIMPYIEVEVKEGKIYVSPKNDTKIARQMHGTTNSLINNMIIGVSKGYEKGLEIIGVGYRFNPKGKVLEVNAGYSHKVQLDVPEGITVDANSATEITVKGIDKEAVGKFAAEIREVRKPEPYKGKGIRYKGEHVRRKEGKKASK